MSKVYKTVITVADRFVPGQLRPLWEHPAGPKTVFFWAPAFKWGLVLASLGDLNRPAEKLSVPQSGALAITGMIWTKYSLDIIPVNYSLMLVNILVALTNSYQGLVTAGLGDLSRPVETLSIPQSASLAATGIIWSRYSLVIIPKNYSLFAVNVFVAISSIYQLSRAYRYQMDLKKKEAEK